MNDLTDKGIGGALSDGQTLFTFLGSFWKHVYEDPDFIERFCDALGLLSAQLEQEKNEARAASGRTIMPVFTRKRWFCIKLSPETRNICNESKVKLESAAPVIGPQPAYGTVPKIGFGGYPEGFVFYPLPTRIVSAASAHERAYDPETTLISGENFTISGDAIIFKPEDDPVNNPSFRKSPDGDGVIVWLKDAMVDNNHVEDYAGYVVNMPLPSSHANMRIVNTFWDIVNTGPTVSNFHKFVCAVLGVSDDSTDVSVHDGQDFQESNVLVLPRGFFKDNLNSGLGFSSDSSVVSSEGDDSNGNPKLKFNVIGSQHDVDAFFSGCWERCEASNVSMADVLGVAAGQTISPRQFMLDNLIGSNIVTAEIDLSKLPDEALTRLGLLSRAIDVFPIGACLSFLLSPEKISEQYDCSSTSENVIVTVEPAVDIANDYVALHEFVEVFVVPGKEENNR